MLLWGSVCACSGRCMLLDHLVWLCSAQRPAASQVPVYVGSGVLPASWKTHHLSLLSRKPFSFCLLICSV